MNSSRRALVTCVSSSAPPFGDREERGCVPDVRWKDLAAAIRLLLSSFIQPKGGRPGSRHDRAVSTEKLKPGDAVTTPVRRELHHKPMGPNASNAGPSPRISGYNGVPG